MKYELPNIALATPEITLLCLACLILVVDLFVKQENRVVTYTLSLLSLAVLFVLTLTSFTQKTGFAFNNTFVRDAMGDVLKLGVYLAIFMVFIYSKDYLRQRDIFKGEFYVLGLFGVLGMMVLISAHNFLTLYMGLELLSLSLYAMVAMQRDSVNASESAMKYFILGAIASGMLLYGMSMIYGVTGSLDLAQISTKAAAAAAASNKMIFVFGMVFLIVGVAFKLGAVPFHMWVPDVYHGAPTSVTVYIASAPKIAAFAMLMRLLVDGLISLQGQWQSILIILAISSMAVGNIIAIAQMNLKRMLAYSAISHIGFLMLGVLTGKESGFAASMFYALAYALMSLGGFGMIILLSRRGFEADNLNDYKGLNERSPWFALMMLILMFSMAGVPPFLGFWAKLSVLKEVVSSGGLIWLAILSVVFSIIGAFYYLRIIKLMYFDQPENTQPVEADLDMRLAISTNSLAVLGLGLFPGALMALCLAAITA
ncbi:MAG: NADH-quinone oxidoreductase subunit NuoN [Gammaproteobacteria bacterium]|nr:NADH-quinone oxidoreductase subunit NuoN [Gammaproteobacteria bacterium]MDH5653047.1 NADH-quinone oxidoreductase subunit NuoN [Gammaproteobacteria bacterium]